MDHNSRKDCFLDKTCSRSLLPGSIWLQTMKTWLYLCWTQSTFRFFKTCWVYQSLMIPLNHQAGMQSILKEHFRASYISLFCLITIFPMALNPTHMWCFTSQLAYKQAHLWVKHASSEEQSSLAGRSLVKRCQESEPALISGIFSFLLCLSEVKYYWWKSGKGEKTVNLLCLTRSNLIDPHGVGN